MSMKSDYETALRLCSESVAREALLNKRWVEWLEKWCAKHEVKRFEYDSVYILVRDDLLCAIHKHMKAIKK